MTASLLLKLFIGITVLLIVCIPESFRTKQGISVDLSCIDPCMTDISYFSRVTVTQLKCIFQEDENKEAIETVAAQNTILSSIILGFYMTNSTVFICYPQRKADPLTQELNAQGTPVNVSLNIRGIYFHYSDVESNFVMVDSQEDKYLPFSLEIHINNLTGRNRTMDQLNYQDLRVHHDFMNVSLHFESQIPFYTRPLGIIWLILISLVFLCGLIFIAYKVKQERKTAPLIDYNQERSSIPKLKEEHNMSQKAYSEKNDHICKQEGQKNQKFCSNAFLPIIAEQQDTVYK
ncbi:transmembrane protein 156 [Eleutherodactylus coqui]|uniref:transmembrane protein 156 n=1 Tax=Eleutherodactylus coqui TaxID=57060 RepID=UPI00346279A2